MTKQHQLIKKYNISADQLMEMAEASFRRLGWKMQNVSKYQIEAKVSVGILSWGENIKFSTSQDGEITLTSESSLSTTMVDWGKNEQNVNKFITQFNAEISSNSSTIREGKSNRTNISAEEFILSHTKIFKLYKSGLFNEEEYIERKRTILKEFAAKKIIGEPEDFLTAILFLKENGILDIEEIQKIKAIIL